MFQLGKMPTKENATQFFVYHDGMNFVASRDDDENPPTLPNSEQPCECITFYLAPETGRVARKIADEVVELNSKKRTASMRTGSATMERIVSSVVWVEGLLDAKGNEVHKINQRVHDDMPSWLINALSKRISKLNRDEELGDETEG